MQSGETTSGCMGGPSLRLVGPATIFAATPLVDAVAAQPPDMAVTDPEARLTRMRASEGDCEPPRPPRPLGAGCSWSRSTCDPDPTHSVDGADVFRYLLGQRICRRLRRS